MAPGQQRLVLPRGSAPIAFVSTAMIVAGVGLAWGGLLLAAAGLILSWIDTKELLRLNPWMMRAGDDGSAPKLDASIYRVSRVATAATALGALVAVGAVQLTGDAFAAVPPAVIAGVTSVVLHLQLARARA